MSVAVSAAIVSASCEVAQAQFDRSAGGVLNRYAAAVPVYLVPSGTTIDVCFIDGTVRDRAIIKAAFAEWSAVAAVRFDSGGGAPFRDCLGAPTKFRVQITAGGGFGFATLGGVGQPLPADQVHMKIPAHKLDEEMFGTALHETGHALGFMHEHQHPASSCAGKLSWPKICEKVRAAGGQLAPLLAVAYLPQIGPMQRGTASAYDPESVMQYRFSAAELPVTDPACVGRRTNFLSASDRARSAYLYPPSKSLQQDMIRQQGILLGRAILSTPALGQSAAKRIAAEAERRVKWRHPGITFRVPLEGVERLATDGADKGEAALLQLKVGFSETVCAL